MSHLCVPSVVSGNSVPEALVVGGVGDGHNNRKPDLFKVSMTSLQSLLAPETKSYN